MRAEDVKSLMRIRPFVPLRIYMTDGTVIDVKHPDMAIVHRSWITVGVEGKEGSGIAEREMRCSLLHVVRIEDNDGQVKLANDIAA